MRSTSETKTMSFDTTSTFGLGAAVGAFATKQIPNLALGIPVIALLLVLLRCESPGDAASP